MRMCLIADCEAPVVTRGWCGKHYARWKRHGDPEYTVIRPHGLTLEEAFRWHMPGEPPAEGCWEWTSGGNGKGYGQMEFGGKGLPAHAVSYQVFVGDLADDDLVRHTCDNPPCVNPAHLLPGTPPDNRQDCVERGRQARGEGQHLARLTEAQVIELRERYAAGQTLIALADQFGICQSAVSSVVRGETWKHLEGA